VTPPAESKPVDRGSLDRSALSGVAWSGAAKWTTQLVSWAGTIVVARILVPADYGLLTMATVFVGLVAMLSEFGIGSSVITLRSLPEAELRQLNGLSILLGVGGTLLTGVMAYPLSLFFRAPDLVLVLPAIGLTFLTNAFAIVPASLLRRERAFRTLAIIDVTRGLVMPAVTLSLALLGFRYWSLVIGSVAGSAVTAGMTLRVRRERVAWPRMQSLAHVLSFSRDVLVSRLAWVIYQDGDFAVAGRRLSQAAVGDYSLAWTIASGPIEKISMVLSDVTPTLFSAVQDDRPALRRYYLNLSEMVCLVTFPTAVGLSLVSRDLVAVLLGPKWSGAAAPMALLALYAGARSVTGLGGHLFIAVRETRFLMWNTIFLAIALMAGFIIGSHWGGVGIAAAWLVIHPLFSVYVFQKIRQVLDLPPSDYIRSLRLGLDGSLAMAAVVLAFHTFLAQEWTPTPRLIASIGLGAATYVATTLTLHRARLWQILEWMKRVRRGGSPAA
jgi:PST family polysaccharide transporter